MPALTPWEIAGVVGAGVVAGTVNTVVGSGSLLTFPTLVAFGYSPLVANVSNTLGLVPGSVSGAVGLSPRAHRPAARGFVGSERSRSPAASLGAGLLLILPSISFERVVPYLVVLACALVVVQPRLSARMIRAGRAAPAARAPAPTCSMRRCS